MTTFNTVADAPRTPNLNDGQALLFEALFGFKGHVRIDTRIFRVLLTPIEGTSDGRRAALDLVGTMPDGAIMTGKLIQNLDEPVCSREIRPAPLIQGHVTIGDAPGTQFELVAWQRISKAGSRYVSGRVSAVTETDV